MNEATFNALAEKIAGAFVECYGTQCEKVPKKIVLVAMTGALAARLKPAPIARASWLRSIPLSMTSKMRGYSDDPPRP